MKVCTKCGEMKSLQDFSSNSRSRNGRQARCRSCCADWMRNYKEKHPERVRETLVAFNERRKPYRWKLRMASEYNLTVEQYEAMLESQGGGCAICAGPQSGPGNRFHIDHDHSCCPGVGSCGKCIRGLLCGNCNTMVGLAKESPERLLAAVAYLRRG